VHIRKQTLEQAAEVKPSLGNKECQFDAAKLSNLIAVAGHRTELSQSTVDLF
jgi:hypothetical protein